jgi:hypothetical protein
MMFVGSSNFELNRVNPCLVTLVEKHTPDNADATLTSGR